MSDSDIVIEFFDGKLQILNINNIDDIEIDQLWEELRNNYQEWVSDVRLIKFDNSKNIIKCFQWRGVSTWWASRLVAKNTFTSNLWFNRLMVLYLVKHCGKKAFLTTDDSVVIRSIKRNNLKISYNYTNSLVTDLCKVFYTKIKDTVVLCKHMTYSILISIVLNSKLNKEISTKRNVVWFRTLYPINWPTRSDGYYLDRHYGKSPLLDKVYGLKSVYLALLSPARSGNIGTNFFKLCRELHKLNSDTQRDVCFPETTLSIIDVFFVYLSSALEHIYLFWLSKKTEFRSLFRIGEIDVSDILLEEWKSGYKGYLQGGKLQAISIAKFFESYEDGQIVVTYGELFAHNRLSYFLTKSIKPKTIFVAVQHAMNAKNKMFTCHNRAEFEYNEREFTPEYSPYPDYFLVQGKQYREVLQQFYSSNKISIIGSLKQTMGHAEFQSATSPDINSLFSQDKKVLLIAPSEGGEYKFLMDLFSFWDENNKWQLALSSHPVDPISKVQSYQAKNHPNLDIKYIMDTPTTLILPYCSLLVVGNSTLAIEAMVYNIPSVRYTPLGVFPQFDNDPRIPTFKTPYQFIKWFNIFCIENRKKKQEVNKEIVYDYLYKNDGLAGNRLLKFIKTLYEKQED